MKQGPQIEILMATYNGEKFLQEQLDSIQGQTYQNWRITVRDDDSTDSTSKILESFQARCPGKMTIVSDGQGRSGGSAKNFLKLMGLSTGSILSFADQDDVWLPHKLERSVSVFQDMQEKYGSDTPLLLHHDFALIDAQNNLLSESFDRQNGRQRELNAMRRLPFMGYTHGFSIMFNRPLLDVALPAPRINSGHDTLLACVAEDFGHVNFVAEPLVQYRRHGANDTEVSPYYKRALEKIFSQGASIEGVTTNLRSVFKAAHDELRTKSRITAAYLETYGDRMSPDRRELLEKFARIDDLGILERKALLFRHVAESSRTRIVAGLML